MKFFMPAEIVEEKNCVIANGARIAALGSKALIVTGRHSAVSNGSLRDVIIALEDYGCHHLLFDRVEENPSVETVMKAADMGISGKVDMVIGIGGGSPMDAAKAIALMIAHPGESWEYMYDQNADSSRLPLVLIPTTAGTGSETTGVSVLTRHDIGKKGSIPHVLFADLGLLDGKYLEKAPRSVLANTTMDAFCHMAESYINTASTDYSRMCVDAGLRIWAKSRDVIAGRRKAVPEDYANMLRASCMAGMAIAHTGTVIPHALSYTPTYHLGMAHGKACGWFMGGLLREAPAADRDYLLHTAGFADLDEFDEYFRDTCGFEEISAELLEKAIAGLLADPARLAKVPFAADEAMLRRICRL
ncbi:MAG: iron-containing alcohol dehydrogenase [Lachnospiraceae bacterium]|nr:iron-containing alcohol dehydrogenase [Lachnospiraceae bacterium]